MLDFIEQSQNNSKNNKNINKDLNISGIDLGVVNTATLAHYQGLLHQVYSGSYINHQLTKLNEKLDNLKTTTFENYIQTINKDLLMKVKHNQAIAQNKSLTIEQKQQQKIKLSKAELILVGQANKQVYQNKTYSNLLVKIENLKNNHLHQLSNHIINKCLENYTQVLCIGKNEGWKQEVEMNKQNNRLFTSLPHDKLVDLLTYKATQQGLIVLTTEESYTSQASFMHQDTIPVYQKVKFDKDINKENNKNQDNNLNNDIKKVKPKKEKVKFSGTRDNRIYTFNQGKEVVLQGKTYQTIHADLNGALNIPRKVFKGFNPLGLLSLNYEVIGKSTYHKNKSSKKLNNINKKNKYQAYFNLICNNNGHNNILMPTSKGCSFHTIGS